MESNFINHLYGEMNISQRKFGVGWIKPDCIHCYYSFPDGRIYGIDYLSSCKEFLSITIRTFKDDIQFIYENNQIYSYCFFGSSDINGYYKYNQLFNYKACQKISYYHKKYL